MLSAGDRHHSQCGSTDMIVLPARTSSNKTTVISKKNLAALCICGANNRSTIHTHVHPRDARHDVSLNIGLDLWSQLTLNILMLSDLLDLLDHVEIALTVPHDLANQEIRPFISNLEVDKVSLGQINI